MSKNNEKLKRCLYIIEEFCGRVSKIAIGVGICAFGAGVVTSIIWDKVDNKHTTNKK